MGGTPVGILDVVKMDYQIGIGKMDDGIESMLAWTDSFTVGVTLSSISWGFVNPGAASGDVTNVKITVTLHDIAGQLFNDFVKIRRGNYYLYFMGPQSSGPLMGGAWIIYRPIADECSIEFSQTQGFTYTISGDPLILTARSGTFTPTEPFTLTGTTPGVSKTGTFRDYIKELEILWNRQTKDKPTAQVELLIEGTNEYPDRKPNKTNKSEGDSPDFINFTAERKPIVDIIRSLWDSSFNIEADVKNKVGLEINFKESRGGKNIIVISFYDINSEKPANTVPLVCVGDDVNCAGAIYRGQLSGINLNSITQMLIPSDANTQNNGAAPEGSDSNTNTPLPASPNETAGQKVVGRQETTNRTNSTMVTSEGRIASPWEEAITMMRKSMVPDFTMSIELPYTSDLAPAAVGGILMDANGGDGASVGIHMQQGMILMFYWYTDPLCESLALNPLISTTYRITKVTHTIGLSGNTTQLEVSHIQQR